MKKVIILSLLSGFFLVGCGNSITEKSTDKKVDQLESRVKELETSSSSEDSKQDEDKILSTLTTETNKIVAKAFLDSDLKMFNPLGEGPHEIDITNEASQLKPLPESGFSFYTEKVSSGSEYMINIYNYKTLDQVEEAYNNIINDKELLGFEKIQTNDSIFSIITASQQMNEQVFDNYKKSFEQIKRLK